MNKTNECFQLCITENVSEKDSEAMAAIGIGLSVAALLLAVVVVIVLFRQRFCTCECHRGNPKCTFVIPNPLQFYVENN